MDVGHITVDSPVYMIVHMNKDFSAKNKSILMGITGWLKSFIALFGLN